MSNYPTVSNNLHFGYFGGDFWPFFGGEKTGDRLRYSHNWKCHRGRLNMLSVTRQNPAKIRQRGDILSYNRWMLNAICKTRLRAAISGIFHHSSGL